jgi:hypothetical protein
MLVNGGYCPTVDMPGPPKRGVAPDFADAPASKRSRQDEELQHEQVRAKARSLKQATIPVRKAAREARMWLKYITYTYFT